MLHDFYVDDLLTGTSTIQEALKIKEQTRELGMEGGFELTKWSSNHFSLRDIEGLCRKEFELASSHNNETRALDVIWNCESDVFKFTSIGHLLPERPTKRSILSRIALVFDPLGWLGSSVIIAKFIMQELWQAKIDWDESISNELYMLWREYEGKIQSLSDIKIPRKVIIFKRGQESKILEIHGFLDTSQRTYAFIFNLFQTMVNVGVTCCVPNPE